MELTEVKAGKSIQKIFEKQKKLAIQLRSETVANRKGRLQKLRAWIRANRAKIHQAMHHDFQKAAQEVDAIEIFHVLNEIKLATDNLEQWARDKKVDAPVTMLGTRSFIKYEPKGVCLIISPWNYPFSLAVGPLVSALAAGNTVILKPSEMTPHVSALLSKMTSELFEEDLVFTVEGDAEVAQALLQLPFDHIFFTGSPAIGKIVMKAAAAHLTSVTLELGGKSPVFVAASANINEAAERISVGKFVNNGQTCVAPDYVLVDEKIEKDLIAALIKKTKKHFEGEGFQMSESYCRIVNGKHFSRISTLIEDAIEKGAKVEWHGMREEETRFIHPVILSNVPPNARMLEEEIFGPVLPIIPFNKVEDAIQYVNNREKPLSLYIFSSKRKEQELILTKTSAGGVCINDCGVHFLHHNLPFGGTNNSGIGKSHGHYGFMAFSHEKAVLKQRSGMTTFKPFYPPYTATSRRLMDWFLKFF